MSVEMVGLVSASAFSKMWELLHASSRWARRGWASLGGDAVPQIRQKKSPFLQFELPSGVLGSAAARGLRPHILASGQSRVSSRQGRCLAGAGMFCSRLHHPAILCFQPGLSCAGPHSLLFWAVNCSPWYAGRSWEEWESCLWQESSFIAPSEMSRW